MPAPNQKCNLMVKNQTYFTDQWRIKKENTRNGHTVYIHAHTHIYICICTIYNKYIAYTIYIHTCRHGYTVYTLLVFLTWCNIIWLSLNSGTTDDDKTRKKSYNPSLHLRVKYFLNSIPQFSKLLFSYRRVSNFLVLISIA